MVINQLPSTIAITPRVITPSGHTVEIPEGRRLVFGRGPRADLPISVGPGLSRRAGVLTAMNGGVWIANISCTHALYTEFDGSRIRLPRMSEPGEPNGGWYLRAGSALVGSRAMLDEERPLRVLVPESQDSSPDADSRSDGDSTLLPLSLDPNTKQFLVAVLWCRPWLIDQTRTTPLPRAPEIARAALDVTGACYELERFDGDPLFRDRLSARVGEHLKVLRRKITERGLVRAGTRLSDEVVVEVLIENTIITTDDLARLNDPEWCSRQEDLWWTGGP
jgi:hypothetical protein